jgi:peptidoglycan/LPS O-acetylase OafA/YrhL
MHLPHLARLRGIDALRGAAALGVVFYHAVAQGDQFLPNNFFRYPIRVVQFATSFGYIGVFLFFVISGFCIHLQWACLLYTNPSPRD